MSKYQLEIKQIVDYPRCRVYRRFIMLLLQDHNIRLGGSSGLYKNSMERLICRQSINDIFGKNGIDQYCNAF